MGWRSVIGLALLGVVGCTASDQVVRAGARPDPEPGARLEVGPGSTAGTFRVEADGYEPGSDVAILVCLASDLPTRLAEGRTAFDEGAACDQDAATVVVADADGSVVVPAFELRSVLGLPRGTVDCATHEGGCAVTTAAVATRDRIAWQPVEVAPPGP